MDAIFIACMLYRGNHPYTSFEGADDYFQEDSKWEQTQKSWEKQNITGEK